MQNITIVPRLEDYESRIRLLKEKATKEFVDELFAAATKEFYAEDRATCLYRREKIFELLSARATDLLPPPGNTFLEPNIWERQTNEQTTLGTTRFEKTENKQCRWKTEVSLAAAFSGKALLDVPVEKIGVSAFAVYWSSRITPEAEIQEAKLEKIDLIDKRMIFDTIESRKEWSLPSKPAPFPQTFAEMLKNISFKIPN